jgi:hypothetical protein
LDSPEETDAEPDAVVVHHDASVHDAAEEDALPTIDAFLPDVPILTDCPDAGSTLIYLITEENELLSFYPPTLAFTKIGNISCPTNATPFSMGVDRLGTAYSSFTNGGLFRINTADAGCQATTYAPDQAGFKTFCMGYASASDGGDTLYVADCSSGPTVDSLGLGSIDTTSFVLTFIGSFNPTLPSCELTGTGDGRLFAYCVNQTTGSEIVQIDETNANVIASNPLVVGSPNDGFAFAFWGGVFWIFTTPGGTSTVTRYDPATQSETTATTFPGSIVGAGVSTCAPE